MAHALVSLASEDFRLAADFHMSSWVRPPGHDEAGRKLGPLGSSREGSAVICLVSRFLFATVCPRNLLPLPEAPLYGYSMGRAGIVVISKVVT